MDKRKLDDLLPLTDAMKDQALSGYKTILDEQKKLLDRLNTLSNLSKSEVDDERKNLQPFTIIGSEKWRHWQVVKISEVNQSLSTLAPRLAAARQAAALAVGRNDVLTKLAGRQR